MEIIKQERVEILDFEKEHGLRLIIGEGFPKDDFKWIAFFEKVVIESGFPILVSGSWAGKGDSVEDAINVYIAKISGYSFRKADDKQGSLIKIPYLVYTPISPTTPPSE